MNCPVCATDVSVGARACPRCNYQFPTSAQASQPEAPAISDLWPAYVSGAWPEVPVTPRVAAATDPVEPAAGTRERGFGYQSDSWPQVPTSRAPARDGFVVPPPAPPFDASRRDRGSRNGLVIGAIVVCILVGAAAFWEVEVRGHGGSQAAPATTPTAVGQTLPVNGGTNAQTPATPTPDTTTPDTQQPDGSAEYTQVAVIEAILTRSTNSRNQLHRALQQPCSHVRSGETSMRQVLTQRQQEIAAANALDVSLIPNGGELKGDLVRMLTYSLQADQAYHQGDLDVINNGCGAGKGEYQQGDDISLDRAQPAKVQFFNLWTPLAESDNITPVHTAADA